MKIRDTKDKEKQQFPGKIPTPHDRYVPKIPDPPVPNRAWTEMKLGRDIDDLDEETRRDLYLGRDPVI